uniref:TRF2-interacting telomeric protein/Rap1 C-terminal domain-containing protein n=1 Tax=Globisporangium ultimum (strain ATCC 200006 / CBS 805.95 / DAOM BR144) TaxID=431595 RepID=K3X8H6_GLOUD
MASASLDSSVRPSSLTSFIRPPPKETIPEKGETSLQPAKTAEVIKPPPKAATPEKDQTAEQATLAASEPTKNTPAVPLEAASLASAKQQNKQDMPQSPPSAQGRSVDGGATVPDEVEAAATPSPQVQERTGNNGEARAEVVPAVEVTNSQTPSTASSERRIGGIFFRSRWAELINDPANRKQLNTYCTLSRQQMPPSRASQKNRQSAKQRVANEAAPTKDAVAASRGKKRRMGAVADEDEESKEQERQAKTCQTSSAAQKKRKVQSTEAQNQAPSTSTGAEGEVRQKTPMQREIVDVTSDTEIDELICQIQFETCQDLASVTHALYYCSGDVEVTTKFLNGEFPSDVWSPEDDLLLVDFMDPATDLSRITEAQRTGAFSKMRVRRSVEKILTRIQYLL